MSEKIPPQNEEKPSILPEEQEGKERELSPEAIEKIMEKVQNIKRKGTAYSVIGATRSPWHGESLHPSVLEYDFPYVLKSGLLGNPIPKDYGGDFTSFEEWWAKQTRKRKRQYLFFNIVGRTQQQETINRSYWWKENAIGVIFDISAFQEQTPGFSERKIKTYQHGEGGIWMTWENLFGDLKDWKPGDKRILEHPNFNKALKKGLIDEEGMPLPSSAFGFVLFARVAPRYFQGIVIGDKYTASDLENITSKMGEVYQEKDTLLLPVYDGAGNLLYPKKITYEEVKKIVAEREEKKQKEE